MDLVDLSLDLGDEEGANPRAQRNNRRNAAAAAAAAAEPPVVATPKTPKTPKVVAKRASIDDTPAAEVGESGNTRKNKRTPARRFSRYSPSPVAGGPTKVSKKAEEALLAKFKTIRGEWKKGLKNARKLKENVDFELPAHLANGKPSAFVRNAHKKTSTEAGPSKKPHVASLKDVGKLDPSQMEEDDDEEPVRRMTGQSPLALTGIGSSTSQSTAPRPDTRRSQSQHLNRRPVSTPKAEEKTTTQKIARSKSAAPVKRGSKVVKEEEDSREPEPEPPANRDRRCKSDVTKPVTEPKSVKTVKTPLTSSLSKTRAQNVKSGVDSKSSVKSGSPDEQGTSSTAVEEVKEEDGETEGQKTTQMAKKVEPRRSQATKITRTSMTKEDVEPVEKETAVETRKGNSRKRNAVDETAPAAKKTKVDVKTPKTRKSLAAAEVVATPETPMTRKGKKKVDEEVAPIEETPEASDATPKTVAKKAVGKKGKKEEAAPIEEAPVEVAPEVTPKVVAKKKGKKEATPMEVVPEAEPVDVAPEPTPRTAAKKKGKKETAPVEVAPEIAPIEAAPEPTPKSVPKKKGKKEVAPVEVAPVAEEVAETPLEVATPKTAPKKKGKAPIETDIAPIEAAPEVTPKSAPKKKGKKETAPVEVAPETAPIEEPPIVEDAAPELYGALEGSVEPEVVAPIAPKGKKGGRKSVGKKETPAKKVEEPEVEPIPIVDVGDVSIGGESSRTASMTPAAEDSPATPSQSARRSGRARVITEKMKGPEAVRHVIAETRKSAPRKKKEVTPSPLLEEVDAPTTPATPDVRLDGGTDLVNVEEAPLPNVTAEVQPIIDKLAASLSSRRSVNFMPPVRQSTRTPKPNRMYDADYTKDIIAKSKVLESSGLVAENITKIEIKVEKQKADDIPSTSARINEQKLIVNIELKSIAKKEVKPKLVNGVLEGYVPSMKPVLKEFVMDGEIVDINQICTDTIDKLLYEVCQDGIKRHFPPVVRRGRRPGYKKEPKPKPQQIQFKTPILPDELTKRRRQAPKNDDYLYPPLKKMDRGDREASSEPVGGDQPGTSTTAEERARQNISRILDMEMQERMEEAKDLDGRRRKSYQRGSMQRSAEAKRYISLEEYMEERNVQNRPDCGIKLMDIGAFKPNQDEMFYHEMLVDYPKPYDDTSDEDLDVDIEEDDNPNRPTFKEFHDQIVMTMHGDSIRTAEQIVRVISRPSSLHQAEYTLMDVIDRIAEEEEEKKIIVQRALEIIQKQHLSQSALPVNCSNIESKLYNTATANAQKLRNVFSMHDGTITQKIYWVHKFFIQKLPIEFLSAYLTLLKYGKQIAGSYYHELLSRSRHDTFAPFDHIGEIIWKFVQTRPIDPEHEALNETVHPNSLSDAVFLMASPSIQIGEFQNRIKYHENIFKWLKTIGSPESEIIRIKEPEDLTSSVAEVLSDNMVYELVDRVRVKQGLLGKRIILVGYGWTTYVVHRVVNLVPAVSAVISLGFPVRQEYGRRGNAEDDINLTYCPTMFVVGAEGKHFDNIAMKDLRQSMLNPTGLLVVGHASDQLQVSTNVLNRVGVTQRIVNRLILEKIIEFLRTDETNDERTNTIPADLNNVLGVDASLLKSSEKQPLSPIPNATAHLNSMANRRNTTAGDERPQTSMTAAARLPAGQRKREMSSSAQISASVPVTPTLAPPLSISGEMSVIDGARAKFQEAIFKNSRNPEDSRRGETIRHPLPQSKLQPSPKPNAPIAPIVAPSQQQPTTSRGPIDPASISLS